LTALIIAQNIKKFILKKYGIKDLYVSGGGAYNKTLMNNLKILLPLNIKILDTLNPMAKEAACFAYLAHLTLNKIPVNKHLIGTKKNTIIGVLNLP